MSEPCVQFHCSGPVARIVLDRPAAYNAIDAALALELRRVVERVRSDPALRCLVITGAGKAFCAGGDVNGFEAAGDDAPGLVRDTVIHLHAAVRQLQALELPVLAAVNGPTAGAGMGLMMAADLAIASDAAHFTMAYTAIAASPDGSSTWFLPRIVGLRRALELTYTNRRLTAAEALDWGLVNEVVAAADFEQAVEARVGHFANGPTRAFATARRLLQGSFHASLAEQLEREGDGIATMAGTDDFREGCAAFLARRAPRFEGR